MIHFKGAPNFGEAVRPEKVDMFSRIGGKPTGSKITALVLGWVEDSAFRSDSQGFGVAGSFSRCAFAWIVW